MKKKMRLGIILVIIIVAVTLLISYKKITAEQKKVENSAINLEVMLQRKADLIPELVSTVKSYRKSEYDAINAVTQARTKLVNANTTEEKSNANKELTQTLDSLRAIIENDSDLKNSPDFKQILDELDEAESRLAVATKDYNEKVKILNSVIQRFPNNLLASIVGAKTKGDFEQNEKSTQTPTVVIEEKK